MMPALIVFQPMVHRVWLLADCLPTFDVAVTLQALTAPR